MKFNATELEMIAALSKSGKDFFSTCNGRKPTGGRCDVPNTRKVNAAIKLRDAGLVTVTSSSWVETARGYSLHGHEYEVRVTDKFKEFLDKERN